MAGVSSSPSVVKIMLRTCTIVAICLGRHVEMSILGRPVCLGRRRMVKYLAVSIKQPKLTTTENLESRSNSDSRSF